MRAIGWIWILALVALSAAHTTPASEVTDVLTPVLDTSGAEWAAMVATGDIELDAQTGDFKIYYQGFDGTRKHWVFEPASKVNVLVEPQVSRIGTGEFVYRYRISNLDSSRQNLDWFMVRYGGAEIHDVVQPVLWGFFPTVTVLDRKDPVAAWSGRLPSYAVEGDMPGIPPGQSASGFGFTSRYPPGIVVCYARGYVPIVFLGPDAEITPDPRPKLLGDCVGGTTIGPVADTFGSARDGLISLRRTLEAAGWSVAWVGRRKEVVAHKGSETLSIQVNEPLAVVNGRRIHLERSATITRGRILVSAELVNHLFRST